VHIKKLTLKTFRCFNALDIDFNAPLILISGANGSGKTTLLEILHYCCYLRSFRTSSAQDLPSFEHSSFFIKALIEGHDGFEHAIHVGVEDKKKLIKVDQKAITTYKELTRLYRVVTLTEDDLLLIKGSPEIRRTWIDQACSLTNPEYVTLMRHFKKVLQQRNALLQTQYDSESYTIWTERLATISEQIRNERITLLNVLQNGVNALLSRYFNTEYTITITYQPKPINESSLQFQERALKRSLKSSLIGAHLDDIAIEFQSNSARSFASRGQQKLTTLLLKIAELQHLASLGMDAILLLDDFMTDFDISRINLLLPVLQGLKTQVFFTSPLDEGYLERRLLELGAQHINLTN
jgi:DNA replication and repair protein RecF